MCADGVLPPHGGWWPPVGTSRGEDDIIEIVDLHDTARAMRAVRRKGRTLLCTARGRELIGQPTRLWERFVGILAHPEQRVDGAQLACPLTQ